MAGAYAAVVSLRHVLENILHPTRHWILLDRQQIQSLLEKVISFQHFLEDYDALPVTSKPESDDGLDGQMAKACYAAEDVIESFVLDQILTRSQAKMKKSLKYFSQGFEKVIEHMDSVEKKVMKIKGNIRVVKDQQPVSSLPVAGLSRLPAPSGKETVVGFDSHLIQVMERLTGQEPNLRMISIVGMGGIGKTTLARHVYDNPLIMEYFDIRTWVTISQEYSVREVLVVLLHDMEILYDKSKQEDTSDEELGEQLYRSLFGRRYLIVLDDMWSIDVWDKVRRFFPNTFNGSRIMITTRIYDVAVGFGSDAPHEMDFLDEEKSWNLFCETVFPRVAFPIELEEIGKKIARSCGGLPLALAVIGGLLAKSKKTIEEWEYVAENLNSIINLENDEQCFKLLFLSYSYLPVHLKPCFLYLAIFPEDYGIRVSKLMKLWIAEGFLKPVEAKSLEDVAMEYLEDLIDRNLIIVYKRGKLGKIKTCTIHDLLRDLCLKEAQKENFLCITRADHIDTFPPNIENKRRLCIRTSGTKGHSSQSFNAPRSASFARSLVCNDFGWGSWGLARHLKLLRVLDVRDGYSPKEILQLVNSRYLNFYGGSNLNLRLSSSVSLLWNLQILIARGSCRITLPSEIWKMVQLRHLEYGQILLSDPPHQSNHIASQDSCILENLQTLSTVKNLRFTEEVLKRIPNLKKMKIVYEDVLEY